MGNKKKSAYNIIFSVLSQIVTILIGLIIPRITLIGYGSQINGLLNSVTQFIAYLILFEAGIQIVATQSLYKSIGDNDCRETNEILSAVNKSYKKIGILYFCGLLFLSLIYPLFTKTEDISYLTIFLVVFFSGFGNVISFFFQGKYKILLTAEGKSYIITNINTIISILNNVLKIILLYIGLKVSIVIIATFFVSLLQVVYILVYIKKRYKWIDLSATPKFDALRQNKSALIHQVSGLIFSNTDVFLLTIVCGLKTVSVYSIYKLINDHVFKFIKIPVDSCSFAFGQRFNTEKDEYIKSTDALEVFWASLSFAVFSVVLYFVLPFVSLYTKDIVDINYVDKYLAILFVSYELLNSGRILMLNTINYAGHFTQTLSRTIIESAINLIVSIVGVFTLGIYGVLIGTNVALLYRTIDIIVYANKKLLNRKPVKTFCIYGLNVALFIITSFILSFVHIEINSYLIFVIYGAILTLIIIAVFFAINYIAFKKDLSRLIVYIKFRKFKKKS